MRVNINNVNNFPPLIFKLSKMHPDYRTDDTKLLQESNLTANLI